MIYFSPSKKSFFHVNVHGTTMPEDVIAVSSERHQALLDEHYTTGKMFGADADGQPILVDPVLPAEIQKEHLRRMAEVAMKKSDAIVLRCYEDSEPVPAEWVAYRKQLRAVFAGELTEMPQAPE
jgi:hypothetical protein